MSYQVLARKWRPRTFAELAGQEHVVRPLVNALTGDRLHHAFLFTGTRGVGKTTIARIFAKALNCEQGSGAHPCGRCSSCQEIDQGRFVDLIEVDAASRTKVEDTRELLDNVQYAPTCGRYKVYLIDEVHMLSNHSFNALLKTLEEPPPHVKFLLATTDPQRLPVTILSRCLQFNLKRLSVALIVGQLATILQEESIPYEETALTLIARGGDGSMRDALSLLDQAIAFGDGQVQMSTVATMLSIIDQQQVIGLLDALVAKEARQALQIVAELDQLAPDYANVLAELLGMLQQIAIVQAIGTEAIDEFNHYAADREACHRLAGRLTPEDVQLFYQIALIGRRDLALSPDSRAGFEMILLRMLCFMPVASADATSSALTSGQAKPSAPLPPAVTPMATTADRTEPVSDWKNLVAKLSLSGMTKQLALNCVANEIGADTIILLLDPKHAQMHTASTYSRLQSALDKYFARQMRLEIIVGEQAAATPAQQQAEQAERKRQTAIDLIHGDPNVQAMQATFNAEVKLDAVKAAELSDPKSPVDPADSDIHR